MTNTDLNTDPAFDPQDDAEMKEIHEFDFDRALTLMSIAEKVATVAPKATALLGIAQAELEALNNKAKDISKRRGDRMREAEARKAAAQQEALDADDADEEPEEEVVRPRAIPHRTAAPAPGPGEPTPTRRL